MVKISPPVGMASRALTTRFMITCSSCPGSALTQPSLGTSLVLDVLADQHGGQHVDHPGNRAFRSITFSCRTCRRLNASS